MNAWVGFVGACSFKCITKNFEWAFAGIYGPNADVKRCLWDELVGDVAVYILGVLLYT